MHWRHGALVHWCTGALVPCCPAALLPCCPAALLPIFLKDYFSISDLQVFARCLTADVRYWLAGIKASGIGPTGTVFAIV